jgi:hypothetical protein
MRLDVIIKLGSGSDRRLRAALEILKRKRREDGIWIIDKVHPDLGVGAQYTRPKKVSPFALEEAGKPKQMDYFNRITGFEESRRFDLVAGVLASNALF